MPDWQLDALIAAGRIHESWRPALAPVADDIARVGAALGDAAILPPTDRVFRAFERDFTAVRVLVVGQDPYPTPGHSIGLAFATDATVRPLPRSLANIYRELHTDLGVVPSPHGDLSAWADQGVLLLNRVLTVAPGQTGSHRNLGWERVTEHAIRALVERNQPLVAILWGNDARGLAGLFNDDAVIASAHPSPLSAARGFFGSAPFSRANDMLAAQGAERIDWRLDGGETLFG